ncbi:MAG: succinate dehydrogenase assembly factor 2 [Gammaproteobacteria bacterium]|nr:succinate dehydrogenase assembly factor 2 [Gammaproteobacteria bacterium]
MAGSLVETDSEKRKALWRSRRGTRELDMLLGGFVSVHYETLSGEEKSLLDRLVEVEDPLLTDWLCHRRRPGDPEMAAMVQKILSSRNE